MELIDKKKINRKIKEIEQKYYKLCCMDMDTSTYHAYQRFLSDLGDIKAFIQKEEADITLSDKLFKEPEEFQCVQCGKPVDYPFSVCKACRDEAAKQRDAYVKAVMGDKDNEK